MNETDNGSSQSSEPELYRYIKLYLFGSLEVPSILISIYIIFKFINNRVFRSHINNHSIILLIIVSFLNTTSELPITLQFLRVGYVKPNPPLTKDEKRQCVGIYCSMIASLSVVFDIYLWSGLYHLKKHSIAPAIVLLAV
ncbi:unnamed protein product, partial [Rotaria sp. Silwood1]